MITYRALEDAYMRHSHPELEPDMLYVSPVDFEAVKALFDEEQLAEAHLGAGRGLWFNAARMCPKRDVPDGSMYVYRRGERIGVESIYPTVV